MGVEISRSARSLSRSHTPAPPTPPLRPRLLFRRERRRPRAHDAADLAPRAALRALAILVLLIAQVDRVALAVLDRDLEAERLQLVDEDPEALRDARRRDRVPLHD